MGAALALGLVSLGALILAPAALVALVLLSRPDTRGSAFGLPAGAGVPLLVVAWVNRAGPATTCWRGAHGGGCDQHLDPLPWLAVGVALLVAGVVGQVWRQQRSAA